MKINPVQAREEISTAPQAVQVPVKSQEYTVDLPGFGSSAYRKIDLLPFIGRVVSRDIGLVRQWLIPTAKCEEDAICLGQVLLMMEVKPGEEPWWRSPSMCDTPAFIGILPGLAGFASYDLDDILIFIAKAMINVMSNSLFFKFAEKLSSWEHRQEWAEIGCISYAVLQQECEIDKTAKSLAERYAKTCAFKAMGLPQLQSIDSKTNAKAKKGGDK